MHSKDCLQWLEKQGLLGVAKQNSVYFRKIFRDCLAAEDEEVLIISDLGHEGKQVAPLMAASYYLAARKLNLNPGIVLQESKIKGEDADEEITEALKSLRKGNIVIVCMSQRMGKPSEEVGSSYRSFALEQNHKWASALKLGDLDTAQFSYLVDAVNVDYKKLRQQAEKIKSQVDCASEIHVTADAGTDLYMGIEGKKALCNDGDYRKKGTGGNIPAGEVYIPPKWKNVEGTVVIDGSSSYRFGTQLIKEPIRLTIKKDEVVRIEGGQEAENLRKTFDWAVKKAKHPWGIKRLCELGIGINPKARIVGATTIDEKALGTAHVAFGSNYWFGGTIYAIIHLDQIFRNPKIELDGKELKF